MSGLRLILKVFYYCYYFGFLYFILFLCSDVSVLDDERHTLSTGKYISYLGPSINICSLISNNLKLCREFAGIIRASRVTGGVAQVVVPGLEDPLSFGAPWCLWLP